VKEKTNVGDIVLKTYGLSKKYDGALVLNDVNMTVYKGDIYGFVGENGSGKTTIIRLISGLIFPNAGYYELMGKKSDDPEIIESRRRMGAIVESPSIYSHLNARDNLYMQALILGIKDEGRIKWALDTVGLGRLYADDKKAGNFSLGMRQRLGIAMALMTQADFLVLDEPLNGLDPEGIVEVRNLIKELNQKYGITFLISSHILTELSLVATRYGIISKGHMIKEISADELKNQCEKRIAISTLDKVNVKNALLSLVSLEDIKETPEGFVIPGDLEYSKVLSALQGLPITGINTETTSIEDYYLSVIRGGKQNA
jgi:ABC-2 type transport system ATP-binding protein